MAMDALLGKKAKALADEMVECFSSSSTKC